MADDEGVRLVGSFGGVVAAGYDVVAVDMPIGLPAAGSRACDVEARRLVGARRSSVFPAPLRCVLAASSHAEAVLLARAAGGPAPSVQAWNLVRRVREVDDVWEPSVVEAFPELSFTLLLGEPPAWPKRTAAGRAERLRALGEPVVHRLRGAASDDVLDALALRWTADRVARGEAVVVGDPDARDARGRPMLVHA